MKTDQSAEVTALIDRLGLEPHPEGGWYRQTYASAGRMPRHVIPEHGGDRSYATSIYFLMDRGNFSAFHRLKSDELWFHHAGDSLDIHVIHPDHRLETLGLGPATAGKQPQAVVPGGSWFASGVSDGGTWSLVGCVVVPGFDYRDFELAEREHLAGIFPEHRSIIESFTR